MSAETLPISPARFAEAIKDLSISTLHLKVLEIRNEIAHLDYSNEQLLPFAKGTQAVLGSGAEPTPDQDCADAIQENLVVIERKVGQLRLVRAEVENRGISWTEFQSKEEIEQQQAEAEQRAARAAQAMSAAAAAANGANGANGTNDTNGSTTGNPWTDGTFQTGTIRNGELQMDSVAGHSFAANGSGSTNGTNGGSLSDEQLRLALEERMGLASQNGHATEDDDEGMHL